MLSRIVFIFSKVPVNAVRLPLPCIHSKKNKNKRDEASLCVTKELKQSPLLQLMCIVHMSSEPLF